MQFFAALIEHFVVGIVSMIWILPIANFAGLIPLLPSGEKWSDYKELLIAVGFPAAYVVGMYMDVCASFALKPLHRIARGWFGAGTGDSYARTIKIMRPSPDESVRYFMQLSAREKMARGVALNLLAGAIANLALPKSGFTIHWLLLTALFLVGVFVWMRHFGLVERYKAEWLRNPAPTPAAP